MGKYIAGLIFAIFVGVVALVQHPYLVMNPLPDVEAATVLIGSSEGPHASGWLYKRDLIITAGHVADGMGPDVLVTFQNGVEVMAHLVSKSDKRDLALYKLEKPISVKPLKLNCSEPRAGDAIAATGFPELGKWTTTWGHVASNYKFDEEGVVLVDLRINPGNSGGPVWNSEGEVVGVAEAYMATAVRVFMFSLPINSGIGAIVPGPAICEFLGDATTAP